MSVDKLKVLFIAIFCVFVDLCSETQCMEENDLVPSRRGGWVPRGHLQAFPDSTQPNQLLVQFHNSNNQICLTGSVISFAGNSVPEECGWLMCDGKQYSSNQYPELYKVIGEKYVPSGSWVIEANKVATEKFFHVPDLRGRVIVGVDGGADRVTSNNTLGVSGGEEKHRLIESELANHKHKMYDAITGSRALPTTAVLSGTNPNLLSSAFTEEAGGDQPHNNMQPYLILNYIIKH